MIRKNYSLADERRKFEKQQQSKIQKRQKRQHKLSKLESVDPVRLNSQIKRLEQREIDSTSNTTTSSFTERDRNYLKSLKEDWEFIVANGLHKNKVEEIITKEKVVTEKRIADANKLWGKKSIYFNPELNPLGKVPPNLPNLTKENRTANMTYEDDPELELLGIKIPQGDPPKFYKEVQNFQRSTKIRSEEVEGKSQGIGLVPSAMLRNRKQHVDSSDEEEEEEGEEDEVVDDNDYANHNTDAPEEEAWKKQKN